MSLALATIDFLLPLLEQGVKENFVPGSLDARRPSAIPPCYTTA